MMHMTTDFTLSRSESGLTVVQTLLVPYQSNPISLEDKSVQEGKARTGVPGMVGGMLRHMRSLRTMKRDHGWIHTLLEVNA